LILFFLEEYLPRIVSIQFNPAGKLYDFDAGTLEISPRDHVIVETERGIGIGLVVRGPVEAAPDEAPAGLVAITRLATRADMDVQEQNSIREKEAYAFCNRRIMERNMQMKLVRVEYLFDGSKAIFFFTADGRVDFRDLVKDLAHAFHTRIEMRQIGVRDESKMIGGIGICGRELCCCSFLRDFQPVSVKMAKEQNLALNPSKISGQCGRLLCCLDYEYETYCSLRKSFPKCGKRVRTETHSGVIDKLNLLTGTITLRLDDGKLFNVNRNDITVDTQQPDTSTPARSENQPQAQADKPREPRQTRTQPRKERPHKQHAEADKAVPSTEGEAKQQEGRSKSGRRKNRSRKHGSRKPSENQPAKPEPTTKQ